MRKRQSGVLDPRLYIYGGIALAIAAFGGYLTYKWMIDRVHTAERDRDNAVLGQKAAEALTGLFKDDLNESNAAVAEKDGRLKAARASAGRYQTELAELRKADPAVALSLATAIPDALRVLRRVNAGCPADLSVPCTGDLAGGGSGAGDDGRNSRGVAGGSSVAAGRPANLQR